MRAQHLAILASASAVLFGASLLVAIVGLFISERIVRSFGVSAKTDCI